jgi:uncharacterized protein YbaR (Trm112 family)
MKEKIIRTDIEDMFNFDIDIFVCPDCKEPILHSDRWSCEDFTRFTCKGCRTYIILAGKYYKE